MVLLPEQRVKPGKGGNRPLDQLKGVGQPWSTGGIISLYGEVVNVGWPNWAVCRRLVESPSEPISIFRNQRCLSECVVPAVAQTEIEEINAW